jgi:hypothetical protein
VGSRAVQPFVVLPDGISDGPRERDVLQDVAASLGMLLNEAILDCAQRIGLGKDFGWNHKVSDVVNECGNFDSVHFNFRQAHLASDGYRKCGYTLLVAVRVLIVPFDCCAIRLNRFLHPLVSS